MHLYLELKANTSAVNLPPMTVGKLSSQIVILKGSVDSDIKSLNIQLERVPDPVTGEKPESYAIAATETADGWRCYISPYCVPDASADLKYHVVGIDELANPRWLGTGRLRVIDNPATGSPLQPSVVPPDTYLYNPATGLWHKLIAECDEAGVITVSVEQEGVQR